MPQYIIRIVRRIEVKVLEKIGERIIESPGPASALREASFILGEEYAGQPDVEIDEVVEKPREENNENKKKEETSLF